MFRLFLLFFLFFVFVCVFNSAHIQVQSKKIFLHYTVENMRFNFTRLVNTQKINIG